MNIDGKSEYHTPVSEEHPARAASVFGWLSASQERML
jgi:hypothetical protein